MIGSSVKDFGSFCQKPLEAILYKDSRQLVCNGYVYITLPKYQDFIPKKFPSKTNSYRIWEVYCAALEWPSGLRLYIVLLQDFDAMCVRISLSPDLFFCP